MAFSRFESAVAAVSTKRVILTARPIRLNYDGVKLFFFYFQSQSASPASDSTSTTAAVAFAALTVPPLYAPWDSATVSRPEWP